VLFKKKILGGEWGLGGHRGAHFGVKSKWSLETFNKINHIKFEERYGA